MIKPVGVRELHGGTQEMYKFDNGFGASVVNHKRSYGLELGVVKFNDYDEKNVFDSDWDLCYDTSVTDDVIGHLDEDGVQDLLEEIKELDGQD